MSKPKLQNLIDKFQLQNLQTAPQKGTVPAGGHPVSWDQIANRDQENKKMVRAVCVGGPLDGQMVAKATTYFSAVNLREEPSVGSFSLDSVPPPMTEQVTYSLREFKTEEGVLGFYVIEGLSDFMALQMLLNNYMPDEDFGRVERKNRERREAEIAQREAETKSLIRELAEADQ